MRGVPRLQQVRGGTRSLLNRPGSLAWRLAFILAFALLALWLAAGTLRIAGPPPPIASAPSPAGYLVFGSSIPGGMDDGHSLHPDSDRLFAVRPDGAGPRLILDAWSQRLHVSPDGRFAAVEDRDGVVIAGTDGSGTVSFPDPDGGDLGREYLQPWAPDSRSVAWVTGRDLATESSYHVVIADPSSGMATRIALPGEDDEVVWSTDSRHLAVLQGRRGGQAHVFLVDTASGDLREIGDRLNAHGIPAWSSDGRQLAVPTGDDTVVIADVAARTTRLLRTDGPAYGIRWAPGDRSLLSMMPTTPGHLAVRSISVTGGRARQLVEIAADDATWSPDRTRLAWLRWNESPDLDGIWVLDLADLGRRRVVAGVKGPGGTWPRWSPDGSWIAFARAPWDPPARIGEVTIWIVRPDGSEEGLLVGGGHGLNPLAVDW